jgi:hypothetical protein
MGRVPGVQVTPTLLADGAGARTPASAAKGMGIVLLGRGAGCRPCDAGGVEIGLEVLLEGPQEVFTLAASVLAVGGATVVVRAGVGYGIRFARSTATYGSYGCVTTAGAAGSRSGPTGPDGPTPPATISELSAARQPPAAGADMPGRCNRATLNS